MDTSNLRCCPPDWYAACSNAPLSCKNCLAGMGSNLSLLRFSLNKNLNLNKIDAARFHKKNHPVHKLIKEQAKPKPEINKTLANQVREGYKAERKLAGKINKALNKKGQANLIKPTVRSGAVFGDGDLKLDNLLQIDSKRRHNTKSFTVSWDEYKKGKTQGTNCWAITVTGEDGREHTLMCLELDTFNNLLAQALATNTNNDEH